MEEGTYLMPQKGHFVAWTDCCGVLKRAMAVWFGRTTVDISAGL
jgi:hypothetical protein